MSLLCLSALLYPASPVRIKILIIIESTIFPRLGNFYKEGITYFLVVVHLPFMIRVEVETDLKLPIPPPMLSIPSRPPKEEEKELNSTEEGQMIRRESREETDLF